MYTESSDEGLTGDGAGAGTVWLASCCWWDQLLLLREEDEEEDEDEDEDEWEEEGAEEEEEEAERLEPPVPGALLRSSVAPMHRVVSLTAARLVPPLPLAMWVDGGMSGSPQMES